MKAHGLRVPASLFIISSLLLSAFLTITFAGYWDGQQPVPEFPVGPEIITGVALLSTFLFLRRKNRSK